MTSDLSSPKPKSIQIKSIIRTALALGVVAFVGNAALSFYINYSRFQKGEAAYNAQDCETAVTFFDRIIATGEDGSLVSQSQARKEECAALTKVLDTQATTDGPANLITAHDYLTTYPNSAHAVAIRQRSGELTAQAQSDGLATAEVCDRLSGIRANQLLPQSPDGVPALGYACGQQYMNSQDYGKAIASYQLVQQNYPDHEMMPQVEAGLAKAMVAQAQASGAGAIPQPGRSGTAPAGSTVVVVRNDSPEPMRIAFSGPENRIETLEPCVNCQAFVGTPPESCPGIGPVGVYTLKPGAYDVVVSSSDDLRVTPFAGNWSLRNRTEYSSCFFTVLQP